MSWVCVLTQSYLILCDPKDCSLPGSFVHGIFQARILEWVAISFSKGSSWSRDGTHVFRISCTGRPILYHCAPWEGHSLIIMLKLLGIIYKTFFFYLALKLIFSVSSCWKRSSKGCDLLVDSWAGPGQSDTPHHLLLPSESMVSHLQWHSIERSMCCWDHLDITCNWTQLSRLYKLVRFWQGRCSNLLVLQQHKTRLMWILLPNKAATYQSGMSYIFFQSLLPSA